jgi:hypothetical protein
VGFVALLLTAQSQERSKESKPRFDEFSVAEQWRGSAPEVRLISPSERLIRTRLREAAGKPPNFSGHFRFELIRCGSNCVAGAIVDLSAGDVYPPPLGAKGTGWGRWTISTRMGPNAAVEFRQDSRLVKIRQDMMRVEPELHYFVWEEHNFRLIRHEPARGVDFSKPVR